MPTQRFRPHERIRESADFRRAFDRRRSASDRDLVVYAVENGLEVARLGISVGRKKVRRASDRNRTKRLLREAFRLTKHELPIGVDFVVVPRGKPPSFAVVIAAFPELARAAAARLGRIRKGPAQPC